MNRWPRKACITGSTFTVEYPSKKIQVDSDEEKELVGQINYHLKRIAVYKNQAAFDRFETLVHELLHGADDHAGTCLFGDKKGEAKITVFSRVLADTLVRSKIVILPD